MMNNVDNEFYQSEYRAMIGVLNFVIKSMAQFDEEIEKMKKECKCKCQEKDEWVSFTEVVQKLQDGNWKYARCESWTTALLTVEDEQLMMVVKDGLNQDLELANVLTVYDISANKWKEWKEPSDE